MTVNVQRLMYRWSARRITCETVSPSLAAFFNAASHKASSTRTLRDGVFGALGIVGLSVSKFVKLIGAFVGTKSDTYTVAVVQESDLRFRSSRVNLVAHPARFVVFDCCDSLISHLFTRLHAVVEANKFVSKVLNRALALNEMVFSFPVIVTPVGKFVPKGYGSTVVVNVRVVARPNDHRVIVGVVFAKVHGGGTSACHINETRNAAAVNDFAQSVHVDYFLNLDLVHCGSPFHPLSAGVGTPYAPYLHPVKYPHTPTLGVSINRSRKEAA